MLSLIERKLQSDNYVTLDTEQTLTAGKEIPFLKLTGPRSESNPDTSLAIWNGGKHKGWLAWATKQNAMEFGISDGDFGIYAKNGKAFFATQGMSLDLGKSSYPWNNIFLKGKINDLTLPTGTGTIATIADLAALEESLKAYVDAALGTNE